MGVRVLIWAGRRWQETIVQTPSDGGIRVVISEVEARRQLEEETWDILVAATEDPEHSLSFLEACRQAAPGVPRVLVGGADLSGPDVVNRVRPDFWVASARLEKALPRLRAWISARSPATSLPQKARTGSLKRILVADDSKVQRLMMKGVLAGMGAECVLAEDGRVALELFQGESFDLVVLDMEMPEMDGLEVTRRIRELEQDGRAPVPILLMTANGEAEAEARGCGVTGFLKKPFGRELLVATLETELDCNRKTPPALDDPVLAPLRGAFLDAASDYLDRLQTALDTGDMATLREVAHRIKGESAMFGFVEIGEVGARMRSALRDGDLEALRKAVGEMDTLLSRRKAAVFSR